MTDEPRALRRDELWDRFVDELDRAGQAGDPTGVLIPAHVSPSLNGKRFGELTRLDVKALAQIANGLGRRGDTVLTLFDDMQRRLQGRDKLTRRSKNRK